MSTLLTSQAPSPNAVDRSTEQRAEARSNCPRLARVSLHKGPKSLARLSIVQNISASGIGLFLTQSMHPETLLDIELRSRSVVRRVAKVVHSTRQEGGWLVGCTLDKPLSGSELQEMRA